MARAERASQHCTVVSKSGGGGLEFPHLPSSDRVGVFLYSRNKSLLVLSGLGLQLSATRRPTEDRLRPSDRPTHTHARTPPSSLALTLAPTKVPFLLPPFLYFSPPRLWQGRRREEVKAATLLLRARDSKRGGRKVQLAPAALRSSLAPVFDAGAWRGGRRGTTGAVRPRAAVVLAEAENEEEIGVGRRKEGGRRCRKEEEEEEGLLALLPLCPAAVPPPHLPPSKGSSVAGASDSVAQSGQKSNLPSANCSIALSPLSPFCTTTTTILLKGGTVLAMQQSRDAVERREERREGWWVAEKRGASQLSFQPPPPFNPNTVQKGLSISPH